MNVYLDYLGCRLNQAEIEAMAEALRHHGRRLVAAPAEADLIVLNTCAVTQEASRDSRQRLHSLHAANPAARLIPTGCWATLAPAEAAAAPGVWQVVENARKDELVEISSPASEEDSPSPVARQRFRQETRKRPGGEACDLPGARLRTRLFVKIQDGCDNRCTFCVARIARGPGRSRPLPEILAEINRAVAAGVKEVVLTGVHLGSYGRDLGDRRGLLNLVKVILRGTDVRRLRLSSLEPWDLSGEFFDLWRAEGEGRLCRHLHLPLQSGCAATLRRMARRTTPEKFAALVAAARERIPEVAISTDVIAGFPGETEHEIDETADFVKAMNFSALHVFKYSPRDGTPAATMRGQVSEAVKKERSRRLRAAGETSARAYRAGFLGRTLPVLWEATAAAGPEGFHWHGYTDNYLRVSLTSPEMLWNTVTGTRMVLLNGDGVLGALA